jgi:thiosulfate/3-mercaptopyruvate sulfurtransferase
MVNLGLRLMRKLLLIALVFLTGLGLKFMGFSISNVFIAPQEITPLELMAMMEDDSDFLLLDVRTPLEFEQGYIPGAILLPSYEIEKIEDLGIPKDKKIIVYCAVDPRSKKSVETLSKMGYTNLLRLKGGMYEWRRANGEVVRPTIGMTAEPSPTSMATQSVLVDVDWVRERLGDNDVKIIYLARNGQEYAEGHIPHSLYINPYSDIVDASSNVEYTVISPNGLAELLSGVGIGNEDTVVLYDDAENLFTSRMYWILKYYGHEEVYILDKGLKGWEKMGEPVASEIPLLNRVEYTAGKPDASIIATKDYVLANLENPDIRILDARSANKYEAGHIPGAVNMDWMMTINEDGTFKSVEELEELYANAGLTRDKEVITYCTNGYSGAVVWFELTELLNYPRVRLYEGSWLEWSKDSNLPIVIGNEPWEEAPETTTPAPETPSPTWVPVVTTQQPLELEPDLVLSALNGSKTLVMGKSYTLQVGDAVLHLSIDQDGCLGLTIWRFSIFEKTLDSTKYEGSVTYLSTEFPPSDISEDIHARSDALDNYRLVVDRWDWEDITLTIMG